jgi:hypothetical protein
LSSGQLGIKCGYGGFDVVSPRRKMLLEGCRVGKK